MTMNHSSPFLILIYFLKETEYMEIILILPQPES